MTNAGTGSLFTMDVAPPINTAATSVPAASMYCAANTWMNRWLDSRTEAVDVCLHEGEQPSATAVVLRLTSEAQVTHE